MRERLISSSSCFSVCHQLFYSSHLLYHCRLSDMQHPRIQGAEGADEEEEWVVDVQADVVQRERDGDREREREVVKER